MLSKRKVLKCRRSHSSSNDAGGNAITRVVDTVINFYDSVESGYGHRDRIFSVDY